MGEVGVGAVRRAHRRGSAAAAGRIWFQPTCGTTSGGMETCHTPGKQAQADVCAHLVALIEEHLQADTDAK